MADLAFEELVLDQLSRIVNMLQLLSKAVAKDHNQEVSTEMATQADVDALRQRVQADNATEAGVLQELKDDFAALQQAVQSGASLDLTGLASDIDQLDQNVASDQQLATDNAPPPPPGG